MQKRSCYLKSSLLALMFIPTMHCSKSPQSNLQAIRNNPWLTENLDIDSDGDGLSDFAEGNKYLSDSATDNVNQRRDFTYSVRNVMEVLKPIDIDAMNSDLQDARILEDREKSVIVEIISYPFTKTTERIRENLNWQHDYAGMTRYLAPSRTADWDDGMRTELLSALAAADIHPDQLSDRALVEKVTKWISTTFANKAPFTAYYADFSGPEVKFLEGMEQAFASDNPNIPADQLLETIKLGVSGKQMFQKRWSGSCTPTAILQTTILRALGIPTRLILTVPLLDPNADSQWNVLSGMSNEHVKATIHKALDPMRGWMGHTYNEVFVGGRWTKLNYDRLGQNNLDDFYFGLMIQVNTMVDWADVDFAHTWSARVGDEYAGRPLTPAMTSVNQYQSLEISDEVGSRNQLPEDTLNPPAPPSLHSMTILSSQWADDAALPAWISGIIPALPNRSQTALLFTHLNSDAQSDVVRQFTEKAPKIFELKAEGKPTVNAVLGEGSISFGADVALLLYFAPEQLALLQAGVTYSLAPLNNTGDPQFVLPAPLTLRR